MRSTRAASTLLLAAVAAATASGSATADGRDGRGLSLAYTGPATAVSTPRVSFLHDDCTKDAPGPGCVVARLRPGDRFVSVEVRDEAGGRLAGASVWVESADGHFDILGEVCGDSQEVPFAVPRGYDYLEVHVEAGTCSGTVTPSIVTTGVVDLWFSSRRFG